MTHLRALQTVLTNIYGQNETNTSHKFLITDFIASLQYTIIKDKHQH